MILKQITGINGICGKCIIKCDYCNEISERKVVYLKSKTTFCNMECYKKYLVISMLLKQKNKQKELIIS